MENEIYKLNKDLNLLYVTAESFPGGIQDAFEKLHSLLNETNGRTLFGISFPGIDGEIIYKAAVEEAYPGEAEKYGSEVFLLKKGDYTSTFVENNSDLHRNIKNAFDNLLADPRIDPNGCCVEMYSGNSDVRCMVRINSKDF